MDGVLYISGMYSNPELSGLETQEPKPNNTIATAVILITKTSGLLIFYLVNSLN